LRLGLAVGLSRRLDQERAEHRDVALAVALPAIRERVVVGAPLGDGAGRDADLAAAAHRDCVPAVCRPGEPARDLLAGAGLHAEQGLGPIEADHLCQRRNRRHEGIVDGDQHACAGRHVAAALEAAPNRILGSGLRGGI
jgi:hypothetical protein